MSEEYIPGTNWHNPDWKDEPKRDNVYVSISLHQDKNVRGYRIDGHDGYCFFIQSPRSVETEKEVNIEELVKALKQIGNEFLK